MSAHGAAHPCVETFIRIEDIDSIFVDVFRLIDQQQITSCNAEKAIIGFMNLMTSSPLRDNQIVELASVITKSLEVDPHDLTVKDDSAFAILENLRPSDITTPADFSILKERLYRELITQIKNRIHSETDGRNVNDLFSCLPSCNKF